VNCVHHIRNASTLRQLKESVDDGNDGAPGFPSPPAVVLPFDSFWCVQTCRKQVSQAKDVAINIRVNNIAGRLEGNIGTCEGG
jgi:hypothetical protein